MHQQIQLDEKATIESGRTIGREGNKNLASGMTNKALIHECIHYTAIQYLISRGSKVILDFFVLWQLDATTIVQPLAATLGQPDVYCWSKRPAKV